MARPKIGIFSALFAVGSVLAWKWVQSRNDAPKRAPRELHRWEDEGGKVVTPSSAAVAAAAPATNGSAANGVIGGTADAWHFPTS
jgi:hypothetical protein